VIGNVEVDQMYYSAFKRLSSQQSALYSRSAQHCQAAAALYSTVLLVVAAA